MLTSPHTPLHSPSSTYLRATAYDALGLLEPEYVRIFVEDVPVDSNGAAQRAAISEGATGLSSEQRAVVTRFLDGSFVQVVETSSAGGEALTALALRDHGQAVCMSNPHPCPPFTPLTPSLTPLLSLSPQTVRMWGGFAYDAEVAAILAASTVCTPLHPLHP